MKSRTTIGVSVAAIAVLAVLAFSLWPASPEPVGVDAPGDGSPVGADGAGEGTDPDSTVTSRDAEPDAGTGPGAEASSELRELATERLDELREQLAEAREAGRTDEVADLERRIRNIEGRLEGAATALQEME